MLKRTEGLCRVHHPDCELNRPLPLPALAPVTLPVLQLRVTGIFVLNPCRRRQVPSQAAPQLRQEEEPLQSPQLHANLRGAHPRLEHWQLLKLIMLLLALELKLKLKPM